LEEREQELADKLQLAYKDLDSAKNEMSVEVEQRKAAEEERLQMQEKMKHLEEAADQVTVMKLQANNLTKLNAGLEFKFDSLNVQNTSCLKEMAELEDKLKTKCDEFTELKESVSKLKDVEIKLARMEAENCCTKLDLARQIEEISWLSDSLNEKQNTIAEYKNKIQHLENMNSSYVKKIADQQKELETKCDEIKDLNEAVSRINDVEMKLRNTNAEKCRTKHDLVKKTEEIASIRKTLNEKENVIEQCEMKIKHLERSYRALGVPYVGNPSTPGAEKPPNDKGLMIETPLQFDVSSSTPTRRPSSASPNLMRKRV
jgi:chromosome segregation ATPase